jgi:hypothetical protein
MDEHGAQPAHGATAHMSTGHAPHAPSAHDGADDAEHGHDDMGLGPIDIRMWGAGLLGVAIGLAGALCFALSTGRIG